MENIFLNETAYPKENNNAPYSGPNVYEKVYAMSALTFYSNIKFE
jgi:hypothetical protein